jgi:hypothetical protein
MATESSETKTGALPHAPPRRRLPLMHSFARIKPAAADKKGGVAAAQTLSGWEPAAGRVEFTPAGSAKKGGKGGAVFDHFEQALAPDTPQSDAYSTVCAPLVAQWLDGFDVDVICYGQTGSGKTYTQFGPPKSMQAASERLGDGGVGIVQPDGILQPEHGFILRTGFAALAHVAAVNARNAEESAVLHGSMVEMSIMSAKSQNAGDLLAGKKPCFVDKHHHLEGAVHLPLTDASSLVKLAAAVETRLTRGTKMNNSSSRSHCVTVFTLHHRDANSNVRVSRFQFFDFMGSERFSGANSAHGRNSGSARSTMAGWEGIFANYSLLFLGEAVRAAANARRKKKGTIQKMGGQGFLNELLAGSLVGNAITTMITCLSPSARNGAESLLSCKYSKDMARMQNEPRRQPAVPFDELVARLERERDTSAKIVAKGVAGKYQKKRMAEVVGCETALTILIEELGGGGGGSGGGGCGGGGGSGQRK